MKCNFYGREFYTNANVIVPYADTERIVERAIVVLQGIDSPNICDIGTGSGNIAISLLKEVSKATATAVDISEDALKLATVNAKAHDVLDRLTLRLSDGLNSISGRFDLIVCNGAWLPRESVGATNRTAYTDEADGLTLIRRLAQEAPEYLRENGALIIEYAAQLLDEVVALFKSWHVEIITFNNRSLGIVAATLTTSTWSTE